MQEAYFCFLLGSFIVEEKRKLDPKIRNDNLFKLSIGFYCLYLMYSDQNLNNRSANKNTFKGIDTFINVD